jgi:hypothetical protein
VLACGVDLTPPLAPTPLRPGPVIVVNARHLSWTSDRAVRYSINNPDGVAIYYQQCGFDALQYYRDGWHAAPWSYGCLGDAPPPFSSLAPGDSIVASFPLTNDFIPNSGWYRFFFLLYQTPSWDTPWPEVSRVSPAFYVGP